MTEEDFDAQFPLILDWIQNNLAQHTVSARSIATLGFKRLPHRFSPELLSSAKVVYVETFPAPPLTALGLPATLDRAFKRQL